LEGVLKLLETSELMYFMRMKIGLREKHRLWLSGKMMEEKFYLKKGEADSLKKVSLVISFIICRQILPLIIDAVISQKKSKLIKKYVLSGWGGI
jgi:hypothetical protein